MNELRFHVCRAAGFSAGVLLCLAIAGCSMQIGGSGSGGGKTSAATIVPEVIIPVEATTPQRGDIATYFETTTRVEAERMVEVAAKASARCNQVLAEVGDAVKTGQIVAELERNEAQALYSQSEVQVRKNKTTLDLATRQYEEGLGPKVEVDNARYAYEQALATLESQKLSIENLTIRAPIDGVITSRAIQQGMLVNAGQQVFKIVDPSSFIVMISPPERELPRLQLGQKAQVTIDALRGKQFDARIRRINPSVDPVSGTVKVVLDFDESVRHALPESAFARVKLVMATLKNVLLAPKEALLDDEGRKFVFVARPREAAADGKADAPAGGALAAGEVYVANRLEVQTGLEDMDRVQILSGVTESDLLITSGQHTLKSGTRISVTNVHDAIWKNAKLTADEALAQAEEKRQSATPQASGGGGGSGFRRH